MRKFDNGFTLIEVLISLMIMSIGLMGIASMMAVGTASNYTNIRRTHASMLTHNIEEKMRSNMKAVHDNLYSNVNTATMANPNLDCVANQCNTDEMASYDLWQWNQAMQNLISNEGIVATIVCDDDVAGDLDSCSDLSLRTSPHTITIRWGLDANNQNVIQRVFTR